MRPETIILNLLIAAIFAFVYFRLCKLTFYQVLYLLILPLVLFTPTVYLVFILIISLFLILTVIRSPLFIIGLIVIVFGVFAVYRPKIDFYYDLGMLNTINAQRGEDISVLKNVKLATLLSNKTTLSFVILNHFDSAFSPVRLFASAPYTNISKDYPLSFLFPWDFFILLFLLGSVKLSKKYLPSLLGVLAVLFLPLVSSNEVVRLIMSGSLAYFFAFLIAKNLKVIKTLTYFWLVSLILFDLFHLLTVIPFVLKS